MVGHMSFGVKDVVRAVVFYDAAQACLTARR